MLQQYPPPVQNKIVTVRAYILFLILQMLKCAYCDTCSVASNEPLHHAVTAHPDKEIMWE